jgi:glutathione synthase/RimK-type ligase-like ATP-grasp enzyme
MKYALEQEAYRGFLGLLLGAPDAQMPLWVSRPDRIRAAEFKPSQLVAAQEIGLRIPNTLLTNNQKAVRDFYERLHGRVICKAVWKNQLDLQDDRPGQARFMYTSEVRPEHLEWLDGVQTTMHCFQEQIEKEIELRVVVIGHQVFAIEIWSQQAEKTRLDWRRSYPDLRYAIHRLPAFLEQQCLQLVQHFGLQYSAMDFILTPDGEYIFLEQNPNGQYDWLSSPTGLPLAEAMAHLLAFPESYAL